MVLQHRIPRSTGHTVWPAFEFICGRQQRNSGAPVFWFINTKLPVIYAFTMNISVICLYCSGLIKIFHAVIYISFYHARRDH